MKNQSEPDYYRTYVEECGAREKTDGYNRRYSSEPRASDLVLLSILEELASERSEPLRLLDVGCGNGNLLRMIAHQFPSWQLFGMDPAEPIIAECANDPSLAGVTFFWGDVLESSVEHLGGQKFDIVLVNAVLQVLTATQILEAYTALFSYLHTSGHLINFDGYFESEEVSSVTVHLDYESSDLDNFQGSRHTYLSLNFASKALKEKGFTQIEFTPFFVPVELAREKENPRKTFTLDLSDGRRLSMLEVIAQPWCFLTATRLHT